MRPPDPATAQPATGHATATQTAASGLSLPSQPSDPDTALNLTTLFRPASGTADVLCSGGLCQEKATVTGTIGQVGHWPVRPSAHSRRRSAWPACRAYSDQSQQAAATATTARAIALLGAEMPASSREAAFRRGCDLPHALPAASF